MSHWRRCKWSLLIGFLKAPTDEDERHILYSGAPVNSARASLVLGRKASNVAAGEFFLAVSFIFDEDRRGQKKLKCESRPLFIISFNLSLSQSVSSRK